MTAPQQGGLSQPRRGEDEGAGHLAPLVEPGQKGAGNPLHGVGHPEGQGGDAPEGQEGPVPDRPLPTDPQAYPAGGGDIAPAQLV